MRGSYILLIELKNNEIISIGKSRKAEFNRGYYAYVGSALNGLEQRIHRHLRTHKSMHWHIDYLLKHARIVSVFYKESDIRDECTIAQTLEKELTSIPGFGCSDCDCKSHLFYGSKIKLMDIIDKLQMKIYQIKANA